MKRQREGTKQKFNYFLPPGVGFTTANLCQSIKRVYDDDREPRERLWKLHKMRTAIKRLTEGIPLASMPDQQENIIKVG